MPVPMRDYIKTKLSEERKKAETFAAHRMTDKWIADQVGSSQPVIWRLFNGNSTIDSELLVRVCRLFRVSVDYVTGLHDSEVEVAPTELATVEV